MITNKEIKIKAIQLRYSGKSFKEINKILKISKSTLSSWFKNDPISKKVAHELGSKINPNVIQRIEKFVSNNKARWDKHREDARLDAIKEFPALRNNNLFVAGMMLYWAEGDNKHGNPFRFTNTNPAMISLYVKFLLQSLKVNKSNIRITIILYPDHQLEECLTYWSNISSIPKIQFYKTQFIKGKHKKNRLPFGVCMISCGNIRLKEKFFTWIDLLSKTV